MKKPFFVFLSFIFFSYWLLSFEGLHDDKILDSTTDIYGVIYGNKVELDGTVSKRLEARLEAGHDLYKNKKIQKIIVSGGVGVEGFDEAVVMRTYLLNKGMPKDDIVVDSDGYTTRKTSENAFNALQKNITVVGISQWFHISRVKLSLRQEGFETVYGHAPKYFELRDIYSVMRELPAYMKYILH